MAEVLGQFLQKANSDPKLGGVQTLWRATVPQLYVDVDREKVKALGVPLGDLYAALAATLGAPFWFDLLSKFINIRGAGAPPGKAKKPVAQPA